MCKRSKISVVRVLGMGFRTNSREWDEREEGGEWVRSCCNTSYESAFHIPSTLIPTSYAPMELPTFIGSVSTMKYLTPFSNPTCDWDIQGISTSNRRTMSAG